MSIQGHVDAIDRHLAAAQSATTSQERDRELHFARSAYRYLCSECSQLSEKQVMRDSPVAYNYWKNGVPGL